MKPLGPIPAGFASVDGELAVQGIAVSDLVERAGDTPCFVYSSDMLRARVASLRAVMPDRLSIHYAMKANPFAPVLALMASLVDGIDIASAGELKLATSAGMDPANISFAGPGKRDRDLEAAIAAGVTLNLESEGEADRALGIGERIGVQPRLAVRVNPDFDLRGSGMRMGGGAKPFGIDAERVPALVRHILAAGAHWRGFHIFAGSQALDADAIIETQGKTLDLAAQLSDAVGHSPEHLNLGGGMGIPYFPGDVPVDIAKVGAALAERFADLPPVLADTHFATELGRWLVGEAGVYLTRIVDKKNSHGELYLVTDGGLHHQLAASGNFGTVVRRNYPVAIASRFDAQASEEANVVGCLCTPLDRLADKALLPEAQVGDLVAVFCAGAYGATASPADFLGHGKAAELLV
ncbi:pyridoxal-dependent decarboxylase, exosortase A system-associated [Blastomonas fulva]|uniref:pyridoxal-dependent decarboxylase, exosortase A system-associated n=1 Tax=Blastomonas fulva TaxID=1550728 RepID=UPI0025A42ACE|nr:pyridoxal-dependent decarboxylase, exosortase A system-associated [Blastomonas fulva]MDM7927350.1 pyridoxal-dependent decarboxylase, exosortase A system-associated [Blastomonas fulva]MDM7964790.1 pyridoxal-dependent decarboxylase, exosortase A system-associated [Blastomonas fulva]